MTPRDLAEGIIDAAFSCPLAGHKVKRENRELMIVILADKIKEVAQTLVRNKNAHNL